MGLIDDRAMESDPKSHEKSDEEREEFRGWFAYLSSCGFNGLDRSAACVEVRREAHIVEQT